MNYPLLVASCLLMLYALGFFDRNPPTPPSRRA